MRSKASVLMAAFALALTVGGACAAEASALVWKFNGHELAGEETERIAGTGSPVTFSVLETPITCSHGVLGFKISNTGGHAVGEMTEAPLFECVASSKSCTLTTIQAESLPWPMHTLTIVGVVPPIDYVVFEAAKIELVFTGELCAIAGRVVLKGSMGGLFQAGALKFDKASYETTKTGFKTGTETVEVDGTFSLEALGSHHGETLELGP